MKQLILPGSLGIGQGFPIHLLNYSLSEDLSKAKVKLNSHTFSFILHGSKEVYTNQKTERAQECELLIMRSGNYLMSEYGSGSQNFKSIMLFVSDQEIISFFQKTGLHPRKGDSTKSLQVYRNKGFLRKYIVELRQILDTKMKFQERMLRLKFEELMFNILEEMGTDFFNFMLGYGLSKPRRLIEVVENNKLNRLSLKELAFLANMSLSSFKREFERQFQTTPGKWFREKRLDHAAHLLKEYGRRPTDIFEEVGYETLSNFVQAFKAKFGVTPKQFKGI